MHFGPESFNLEGKVSLSFYSCKAWRKISYRIQDLLQLGKKKFLKYITTIYPQAQHELCHC